MRIANASDEELVDAFINALLQRSEARNARTANRHADTALQIGRELRRRGPEARAKLVTLLSHSNPGVRSWAATYSLDFAREQAEFVLRRLAQEPGETGFSAKMTLELWEEGTLKLP